MACGGLELAGVEVRSFRSELRGRQSQFDLPGAAPLSMWRNLALEHLVMLLESLFALQLVNSRGTPAAFGGKWSQGRIGLAITCIRVCYRRGSRC